MVTMGNTVSSAGIPRKTFQTSGTRLLEARGSWLVNLVVTRRT